MEDEDVMTTAQRVRRAGLAAAEPGDKVSVTISRDGRDRDVHVTLGELPGS